MGMWLLIHDYSMEIDAAAGLDVSLDLQHKWCSINLPGSLLLKKVYVELVFNENVCFLMWYV